MIYKFMFRIFGMTTESIGNEPEDLAKYQQNQ